jgi:4-alpha-glucanotransferase
LPYGTAEKARQGAFDPPEEHLWKAHSLNILAPVLNSTSMLCCAEDLGTVPDCSYEVIDECGIVGMDVIRWQREWENRSEFLRPEQYRINSIAVHATHDMSDLRTWWEYEAGTVDALGIKNQLQNRGFDLDSLLAGLFEKKQPLPGRLRWRKEITDESSLLEKLQRPADQVADILKVFRESAFEKKLFLEWLGVKNAKNLSKARLYPRMLQKSLECRSVFIIHLLQDWLAWSPWLSDMDPRPLRINLPGTIHDNNWRLVMPFFLEDLFKDQDVLATMRSILSVPGEMA